MALRLVLRLRLVSMFLCSHTCVGFPVGVFNPMVVLPEPVAVTHGGGYKVYACRHTCVGFPVSVFNPIVVLPQPVAVTHGGGLHSI